jgi:hypothetical protein
MPEEVPQMENKDPGSDQAVDAGLRVIKNQNCSFTIKIIFSFRMRKHIGIKFRLQK